jgi:hypothetical protein
LSAQYFANLTSTSVYGDVTVSLSSSAYADLSVEIAVGASYEDFTIGFTTDYKKADVIITNRVDGNWEPSIISSAYADVTLRVEESMSYEDICIEIKESGFVDYLIFNDRPELSRGELVIALLPIINSELDEDDRLEDVPIHEPQGTSIGGYSSTEEANTTSFGTIVLETQMDDEFEGWEGETLFKFFNGQVWQQVGGEYHYHYAYMPAVTIYERSGYYYMKVEDVDEDPIQVVRLK